MTIPIRLSAALADRYSIERELGAGGMATVYLAHDVRHDRKVALKVLRPELSAILGGERFLAEIKTTANLQHPHILSLFDSGEADGLVYYVMPYVEGESLRDRLNREKQLPVDEAVRIAREVADALAYAHSHGIVHRDIKPENILLHGGHSMVADFGIALAASRSEGGTRMTETGMSLGTPHYMAPEQAMGEKDITPKADIYALGCVLYEMLTAEPPFVGATAQAIIARVMTEEPRSITLQRRTVPLHVEAAAQRALEKLPADRFASAAEFAAALADPGFRAAVRVSARDGPRGWPWRRIAMAAGAAAALFAGLAAWAFLSGTPPGSDEGRVEFAFRMGSGAGNRTRVTISPDGRRILQAINDSTGRKRLVMRDLGSSAVVTIAGTEGAEAPEFSPDGAWIAFTADGKLHKVPAGGGPSIVLADSVHSSPAWVNDGTILYTRANDGLYLVPASGGPSERLTTLDTARREWSHWHPQALPGGRAAIFNSFSTPIARSRIEALEFSTGRRTVLLEGAVFARYVNSGHLLYVRDGAIFAVPFDARNLRVLGPAVPVVDDVAWTPTDGLAGFAVSENGTLVYLKASEWNVERRVVWADRAGNERPALTEAGPWAEPRLSPDGRWIAVTRLEPTWQIWLFDVSRRVLTQLTRTAGVAFNALWTPDGRSIIHTAETPVYDLFRARIDGTAPDTLVASPYDKSASSVSPDGRTVVYVETVQEDRLMVAPLHGGAPNRVGAGQTSQRNAAFSPDGRWLAYEEASPAGRSEVFVRALGGQGGRRQVSADGGSQPRWTRGGREIVYRRGDAVLAASFQPATGEVGAPALLFRKPDAGRMNRTLGYDVTPDGSRFLMVTPVERPGALPVVVVLNWLDELRARVPR